MVDGNAEMPDAPLIVSLDVLASSALALAGGKAVNLGAMLRAGLPVPPGFCVTTAAYQQAATGASLDALLDELAATPAEANDAIAMLATAIRERLLAAPIPASVEQAVRAAVIAIGEGTPLAIRSSATAEDLPYASFAGQQDTYLNIIGAEAVLDAVRRCWSSLWTERAVTYRARNGIDPRGVRLAVVGQRMVDAAVSGVLFTADPLTGRRQRAVIEASPGLGEAIVSGAVNPDRFSVDTASEQILSRQRGDKRSAVVANADGGVRHIEADTSLTAALTDEQVRALVRLGVRVETLFGAPQDVEFAIDRTGTIWIVQARPITTLFPLPASAPRHADDLRVYFSINVAQGVLGPFTPMAQQAFRLLGSSVAAIFGAPPANPLAGPASLVAAGERLFFDITPVVRSPLGRRVLTAALSRMEARSEAALSPLFSDPRLSPQPFSVSRIISLVTRLRHLTPAAARIATSLLDPAAARAMLDALRVEYSAPIQLPPEASIDERLSAVERDLLIWPGVIVPRALPVVIAGLLAFGAAEKVIGDLATPEELDAVRRALPHNPTTEMDLALWQLAETIHADPAAVAALASGDPADLALVYQAGTLPPTLQDGLAHFLARYGHRGVAEIDLGLPRWRENPTPLLVALANYLKMIGSTQTPEGQFHLARGHAEATVQELTRRAAASSPLRGAAVGFLLDRGRELGGLREMPKFLLVLGLDRARDVLASVGADLAAAGRVKRADDVFFLTLPEAYALARSDDTEHYRELVHARRARYNEEMRRRHVPRLLLSDGSEPPAPPPVAITEGTVLRGTAASAGTVSGHARVIHDPNAARLEPGEILVAPSTDPGWTPLFLTAGGLVMEMGGAMSHGAVVAREYGIPAVVGVPQATEAITSGMELIVDGTAGTVVIAAPALTP